jgi:predicted amidophosphoribosyltransferase
MGKPRCALCGRDIKSNEHYFIYKRYSLCKECGKKFKGNKSEIHNVGHNDNLCRSDSL